MFIALRLLSYSAPSGAVCKLRAHHIALLRSAELIKNRKTINIVLLRSTLLRNRARRPTSEAKPSRIFPAPWTKETK
jgi:hypothetical protein